MGKLRMCVEERRWRERLGLEKDVGVSERGEEVKPRYRNLYFMDSRAAKRD